MQRVNNGNVQGLMLFDYVIRSSKVFRKVPVIFHAAIAYNVYFVRTYSHKHISQSNLRVICDDFVAHLICKEYKVQTESIRCKKVAAANQDNLNT